MPVIDPKRKFEMSDEKPNHTKPRRFRRYYVLILLILVGLAAFGIYRWRLRSQLQARIDDIRAAGYPVTCAELDEWYSIPPGAKNAAYVILDAISYYHDANEAQREVLPIVGEVEPSPRNEAFSAETAEAVARHLTANTQALELLREASAIKHSRYPVNLAAGINASPPDLRGIKSMARLLAIQALYRAENGHAPSAVDSVKSVFAVARSIAQEPMVVSQFTRMSSLLLAAKTVERMLNTVELTDQQLAQLHDVILSAEQFSGLTRAFAGERCQILGVLREPALYIDSLNSGGGMRLRPAALRARKVLGLLDISATAYLDVMASYMEAVQRPEHQRIAAANAIQNQDGPARKGRPLLACLMGSFARVFVVDVARIARLRAARVALAAERYRLAQGSLPDTLSDLLPAYLDALPNDPYDGKHLRYKRFDKGYVLYCIGQDANDDGGKQKVKRSDNNYDITFIVEH